MCLRRLRGLVYGHEGISARGTMCLRGLRIMRDHEGISLCRVMGLRDYDGISAQA